MTVSISQKAVFSSDLVGRYTPYVPDPENPIANFFINPVYADMDPEKVPQIDMGFLFPGFIMPVTTVTGLANQLVGMMYGGGLTISISRTTGRSARVTATCSGST